MARATALSVVPELSMRSLTLGHAQSSPGLSPTDARVVWFMTSTLPPYMMVVNVL